MILGKVLRIIIFYKINQDTMYMDMSHNMDVLMLPCRVGVLMTLYLKKLFMVIYILQTYICGAVLKPGGCE